MKLFEIKETLKATVLTCADQLDKTITGCGSADLLEDILAAATEGCVFLTGVTTEEVIRTAIIARIGAVAFVRGKQPGSNVIKLAENYNIPLLSTRYSLFIAGGRLYMQGLRGLDGSW
jgi:predicted transcriptional regulator